MRAFCLAMTLANGVGIHHAVATQQAGLAALAGIGATGAFLTALIL